MARKRLLTRFFQNYWRLTRSLSLEVRACVRDARGRLALVREEEGAPWRLPGGRVYDGETAAEALTRWLRTQARLETVGDPTVFSLYGGLARAGCDQVVLFLVPSWRQPASVIVNDADMVNDTRMENNTGMVNEAGHGALALETAFFEPDGLPHDVEPAVRMRLAEISQARALSDVW